MGLDVANAPCGKTLAELCDWWLQKCCKPRSRSREESRLRVQMKLERDVVGRGPAQNPELAAQPGVQRDTYGGAACHEHERFRQKRPRELP